MFKDIVIDTFIDWKIEDENGKSILGYEVNYDRFIWGESGRYACIAENDRGDEYLEECYENCEDPKDVRDEKVMEEVIDAYCDELEYSGILPREEETIEEYSKDVSSYYYVADLSDKKVTDISDRAFRGCSVSEIILPETLEYMGDDVFIGCDNLKKIILPSSLKEIKGNSFNGYKGNIEIDLSKYNFSQFDKAAISRLFF